MALEKQYTTNSGVECDYWRIVQINQNFLRNDCVITIVLYVDHATRINEAQPIMSIMFDFGCCYQNREYDNGIDVMRNIDIKESYRVLKMKAMEENEKLEDDRNEMLAWFWDAVDA
jgi:hypothetical protein